MRSRWLVSLAGAVLAAGGGAVPLASRDGGSPVALRSLLEASGGHVGRTIDVLIV